MKISELLSKKKPMLSFEVFPPKTEENYESVKSAAEKIAELKPAFMSVTYGAGGGTGKYTLSLSEELMKNSGITPLSHLTCVSSTKEMINNQLTALKNAGIENILALRGDIPNGMSREGLDFKYACELIEQIRSFGGFCIGGACYPEGHTESVNQKADIAALKIKAEAGCEFFTSQMFFDNNIFYNFMYKIRDAGVDIPVIAGIMPVTNAKQIKRICSLSGTNLPSRFRAIVDRFSDNPSAMQQAGIAYATEQIIDLFANGVNNVHVYSMNKPEVARCIKNNLSEIVV